MLCRGSCSGGDGVQRGCFFPRLDPTRQPAMPQAAEFLTRENLEDTHSRAKPAMETASQTRPMKRRSQIVDPNRASPRRYARAKNHRKSISAD